jgi:hypothetical protein
MAKKKKKKQQKNQTADSLASRLVKQLEAGEPGELASLAAAEGIQADAFEAAFATAVEMLEKGPDPRRVLQLPEAFQLAFIELAAKDQDDDLIGDIYDMSESKAVKKQAKRILHRLRSQGLSVEVPDDTGQSVLDRAVSEEHKPLPCHLSPVSGSGGRMVLMARYTQGGVAVHQGEMTDTDGLVQFAGGTIGRNRYRQMSQEMMADPSERLLEIDYAEARLHLARAVEQCREAGKPPPDEYLEASGDLGEVNDDAAPPKPSELLPVDAIGDLDALAAEAVELLELPEFADWLPDEDTIKAIDEKIQDVESSQVVINDQQRIEQVEKAIDSGVEVLIGDEDKRRQHHDRLMENAVYLHRTGREEQAKQAAAAAWQLLVENFEPSQSKFFDRLLKKLFRSAEEIVAHMGEIGKAPPADPADDPADEPGEGPGGNIIITP